MIDELRYVVFLVCMLTLIAAVPLLQAQTYGEITGTITDASGAVVASAGVAVSNSANNQTRRVTSNESGNFTVPFLAPGLYDIRVEKEGFKTETRKAVDLQIGAVARLNFTIEVGGVTQVLEVTGGAPLLDTENAAVGTVVENRRIVEMPLNGRNYLQLVALSSNVTHEMGGAGRAGQRQGGDRVDQPLSVAGQRQLLNRFTLDGMENTDVSNNTFIIRPSIDALQEFKVQTGVYSAEYGRETAQINVTTKPGSNQFHGALFEFLRNDKFDARSWLQQGNKNPFRRNQFGFVVGGRLIRDKLFFLDNFEALRDRKTLQGLANVATDAMRAGDFSGQPRQIFDPLSRVFRTDAAGNQQAVSATPFPNNTIPQTRFDPIAVKLLQFYPRASFPGNNILSDYVRQRPRPISWEQFTQRLDFNQSAKSTWFGRFSWGDEYVGTIYDFGVQDGRVTTKTYQAMISNTRVFGPTLVNEVRFGYNQFQNDLPTTFLSNAT